MDVPGLHLMRVLGRAGGVDCARAVLLLLLLRSVLMFVGRRGVVLLLLGWGCDVVVVLDGSVVDWICVVFVFFGLVVFVAFVGGVGDHFRLMEVVGLCGSVGDLV